MARNQVPVAARLLTLAALAATSRPLWHRPATVACPPRFPTTTCKSSVRLREDPFEPSVPAVG
ncbi:MAG: hypothetical protein ABR972_09410 [Acidimicrobiales bacterium]